MTRMFEPTNKLRLTKTHWIFKKKTVEIENSFLLGPFHLSKVLFFSIRQMWTDSRIRRKKHSATPPGFEPGSSDCRSDALTTELRSHDRNCVRIFVFHQTVSSFSLRGDPHVRVYKHVETNENLLVLILTVQIQNSFLSRLRCVFYVQSSCQFTFVG